MGTRSRPFYRVVVSDSRKRPEGRVVDTIGHYDPMKAPKAVDLDVAKVDEWVARGAKPSDTVRDLVKRQRAASAAATA